MKFSLEYLSSLKTISFRIRLIKEQCKIHLFGGPQGPNICNLHPDNIKCYKKISLEWCSIIFCIQINYKTFCRLMRDNQRGL